MKRKFTSLFVLIALLVSVSVTPVFAGDDQDGSNPPCAECDGSLGGHWG